MSMRNYLIGLMIMGLPAAALANEKGNGGSVVCDEQGKNCVSADLYFKQRKYELPDYYLKPVKLLSDAALMAELEPMLRMVCVRKAGPACPDSYVRELLESFEAYSVRRFSGEDVIEVEGMNTRQVSYTLLVNQPREDLGGSIVRKLIELDMATFAAMAPRQKALIVFHEISHHELLVYDPQHQIISPFVQALNTLMDVRKRQEARDWTQISPRELTSTRLFQNVLEGYWSQGDLLAQTKAQVDPYHGGAVSELPFIRGTSRNRVGVSARVDVEPEVREVFAGNTFLDSGVRILGEQEGRSCRSNVFLRSFGLLRCGGSKNRFEGVRFDGTWVSGDGNVVKDSPLPHGDAYGRFIDPGFRLGSRNVIEGSVFLPSRSYLLAQVGAEHSQYRDELGFDGEGERALNGATIIGSTVSELTFSRRPLTLVNVHLPEEVILFSEAEHEIRVRDLSVVRALSDEDAEKSGFLLVLEDGAKDYAFDSRLVYDMTALLKREKVSGRQAFSSAACHIPAREIEAMDDFRELFVAKRR